MARTSGERIASGWASRDGGGELNVADALARLQSGAAGGLVTEQTAATALALSGTSPNAAGTVVDAGLTGLAGYRGLQISAVLQGATGGTLDVYLQCSPDGGTTWVDFVHYAQLAAGAAQVGQATMHTRAGASSQTVVGTNLSPALATGVARGDFGGDRVRVLYVAGAGTSAGAAQTLLVTASA